MSTLPYPEPDGSFTGGWSGSDASHDRAVTEARTGRAHKRQQQVWDCVRLSGLNGATWLEVARELDIHHGAASGALSNLHKIGKLERLKERRGRSSIYVLPHAVNGRATAPFGRSRPATATTGAEAQSEALDALRRDLEAAHAAVEVARQEGHDLGWQEGYDRGVEQAVPENMLRDARLVGRQAGSEAQIARFDSYIAALEVEINRLRPGQRMIRTHHKMCWMDHPLCLVQTIRKAVRP